MRPHQEKEWERLLPYLQDIYRLLLHLCKDVQAAEDLTQDTCLRALRYRPSHDPDRELKPWLLKIARNIYRDWVKSRTLDIPLDFYGEISAEESGLPGTADRWLEDVSDAKILEVLKSLPDEFCEVVLLRDVEEMSYQEISEILNCPIGTVMSRIHRGRTLLRRKLVALESGADSAKSDKAKVRRFRKSKSGD